MSRDPELDKRSEKERPLPPRMLGDTDVRVIMEQAEALPKGAAILEVGPWLGGLTRLLANHGQMTVIDRFIWTESNAASYPGIAAPEASFRSVFEANMAAESITPSIIETDLPALDWQGGEIDFVVIDALRTPDHLHGFFVAIASALRPGAKVLIKNALNPRDLGLGAYVDALLGLGIFEMAPTEQPTWCNIAVLTMRQDMRGLAAIESAQELIATAAMSVGFTDPWYGRSLSAFRIAYLATINRWSDAYSRLFEMPASSDNLRVWDGLEPLLLVKEEDEGAKKMAVLSELVWIRNDLRVPRDVQTTFGSSLASRIKAYLDNNTDAEWIYHGVDAEVLGHETVDYAVEKMSDQSAKLHRADVVEVGADLGGGGALAALLSGARSYVGVETGTKSGFAERLTQQYPHIAISEDVDQAIDAINAATVLILGAEPQSDVSLAEAIKARTTAKGNDVTVIRM